jgi:hypothetical protein
VSRKPGRDELLKRLRAFRGRLPADFKFDRDKANAAILSVTMQVSNGNPVYVWLDKTFRLAVMSIGNAIPRLVSSPDQGRFLIAVPTMDGRQVVAGTSDGKVVVFDAGTLREMYETPGSGQPVASLDIRLCQGSELDADPQPSEGAATHHRRRVSRGVRSGRRAELAKSRGARGRSKRPMIEASAKPKGLHLPRD